MVLVYEEGTCSSKTRPLKENWFDVHSYYNLVNVTTYYVILEKFFFIFSKQHNSLWHKASQNKLALKDACPIHICPENYETSRKNTILISVRIAVQYNILMHVRVAVRYNPHICPGRCPVCLGVQEGESAGWWAIKFRKGEQLPPIESVLVRAHILCAIVPTKSLPAQTVQCGTHRLSLQAVLSL